MTPDDAASPPIGVVEIGGGHVTAALVDARGGGRLLREQTGPVDAAADSAALLAALIAPARSVVRSDASGRAPGTWVVALPGPFDYAAGTGSFAGVDKFASLAGLDLRGAFGALLDVEPETVLFVNDAVAYAIGEWSGGAGQRASRMICITLGTGVGSAFLVAGREIDSHDTVPQDGSVHTLTIDGRPLEETVSSPAIRQRFREQSGQTRTVEQICELARSGDAAARDVMSFAMHALGATLAPWVERFQPSRLVVGGAMAGSWDVIGTPFETGLGQSAKAGATARSAVVVSPAQLRSRAPLVGAAEWARER